VNITVKTSGVAEARAALAGLSERKIKMIMRRSSSRAAASTRALVVKTVTGRFGLKSSTIKGKRLVSLSKIGNGMKISIKATRVPAILFGAKQTSEGVSAMVEKGRREVIKSAFIATMPRGHMGVFQRRGKKRLPIDEQFGPSLITMLQVAGKSIQSIADHAQRELDKRVNHELDRALRA